MKEVYKTRWPAFLGGEGLDQTRLWFAWYPVRCHYGRWHWLKLVAARPLLSNTRPGKVFWIYSTEIWKEKVENYG